MGAAHTQTTQQIRREGKIRALCTERRGQRSLEDSVTEALWQTEEEDRGLFPEQERKTQSWPCSPPALGPHQTSFCSQDEATTFTRPYPVATLPH